MKKNEIVEVKIEDIGMNGEGIGKVNGYTLFIKDAIIGDKVKAQVTKAKKNYGYARLQDLLLPSNDRVEPACPVATKCGGCQIQELSYEKQLAFKADKVRNNLKRIGNISDEVLDEITEPIIGMNKPYRYRNKAQYPIGRDKKGKIIAGFYASHTHAIIPQMDCVIGAKMNATILNVVIKFMEKYEIEPYNEIMQEGLVRHVLIRVGNQTNELMVCLVINGEVLPHADKLVEKLVQIKHMTSITLNVNKANTNVIMGDETLTLWGTPYINSKISDINYRISPLSFYQVNSLQTEKLYRTVLDYAQLTGDEEVWDMYCGIGTITLFLARNAKRVYGVEIIPQAIANARENAEINNITNAEFFVGKAEEVLPNYYKEYEEKTGDKLAADVIVVDPPRKGCEEALLQTMVNMKPERIVYVSCDSATFARDVKYLEENGYRLTKVRVVDQFGHTVHTETVGLLEKNSRDGL
jgi:23S rRNA (uracil1939-C5)-methyltransferase